MRALILVAGTALALAACGKSNRAGDTANLNESLSAENIVSNDVTAIDAVTGEAANMAADVDVSFTNEFANRTTNATAPGSRPVVPARPRPAEVSASNETTANQSTNLSE